MLGRDVPLVPYATPGTDDLAKVLADKLKTSDSFLLEKHGAIAVGRNMREAFHRMETLEFMAQLQFNLHALGGSEPLPSDEIERILKK